MRLRAKEAEATHWVALPISNAGEQGTLFGTVKITNNSARYSLSSLALTVLPLLPNNCYVIFTLPDDKFWFIAVDDGTLSPLSDIVGDKQRIESSVNQFLSISTTPQDGWKVYAPSDFFPDIATEEKSLLDMLDGKSNVRRSRLIQTHNKQAIFIWVAAAVVLGVVHFANSAWERYQEEAQVAAAQAALKARAKKTIVEIVKPWATQPKFPDMLNACSGIWKKAPISIAGWVFGNATCDVNGKITLHYSLPSGGTVGDFASRLPAIYGPDIKPQFNIPGRADDAFFSLPVSLEVPKQPEALLPDDKQIQHLTSFAQLIGAKFRLDELDANTTLKEGSVENLPWRVYRFTFITDVPPDRLFASTRFDSSGIRALAIGMILKNNRLEYTIEGLLYANH